MNVPRRVWQFGSRLTRSGYCLGCLLLGGGVQAATPEVRALHVDAASPSLRSSNEITELVRAARAAHFNTLWIQVRSDGRTVYPSGLEPSVPGVPSGYDPLVEILRQAHDEAAGPRLEVHAWLDSLPVWSSSDTGPAEAGHVVHLHPEWLTRHETGGQFGGGYSLDPGHPGAAEHLAQLVAGLVSTHELDGLLVSGLKYPEDSVPGSTRGWGYNPTAVQRFQAQSRRTAIPSARDPQWDLFRRDQVTLLARRLAFVAQAARPELRFSIVADVPSQGNYPVIWENTISYRESFQDWRGWLREGWVDTLVPILGFSGEKRDYEVRGWLPFLRENRSRRHLVPTFRVPLNPFDQTLLWIDAARERIERAGSIDGVGLIGFGTPSPDRSPSDWRMRLIRSSGGGSKGDAPFADPVSVPSMPWKITPNRGRIWTRATVGGAILDGGTLELRGPTERVWNCDGNGYVGGADLLPGEYTLLLLPSGSYRARAVALCNVAAGKTSNPVWLMADDDDDRDGTSNLAEVVMGTDPRDAASKLSVEVSVLPDRLQLQVRPVRPGRRYRLESADQPAGPWNSIADPASLDGSEASVEPSTTVRYFRSQVEF